MSPRRPAVWRFLGVNSVFTSGTNISTFVSSSFSLETRFQFWRGELSAENIKKAAGEEIVFFGTKCVSYVHFVRRFRGTLGY